MILSHCWRGQNHVTGCASESYVAEIAEEGPPVRENQSLRNIIRSATSYRQAQIFARQGVMLDRSTLADWMRHTALELKPLHDRLIDDTKGSPELFMEFEGTVAPGEPRKSVEPRAPVLEPGLGQTKHGYFWSIARDDRCLTAIKRCLTALGSQVDDRHY